MNRFVELVKKIVVFIKNLLSTVSGAFFSFINFFFAYFEIKESVYRLKNYVVCSPFWAYLIGFIELYFSLCDKFDAASAELYSHLEDGVAAFLDSWLLELFINETEELFYEFRVFYSGALKRNFSLTCACSALVIIFLIHVFCYLIYGGKFNFIVYLMGVIKFYLCLAANLFVLGEHFYIIPTVLFVLFVGFYFCPTYLPIPGATPRVTAFFISVLIFVLTLFRAWTYDFNKTFVEASDYFVGGDLSDNFPTFFFSFDPISLIFGLLVSFIFPIIVLTAWEKISYRPNFFYFNIILLEVLVLGAFYTLDLFLFFIFFEAMFIPMGLIILIWGSRQRKIKATNYLFLYTLFGSAFFLTGLIYIYSVLGSTNYFVILNNLNVFTAQEIYFLWFTFFIPFAIKVPMFPFHIRLPEAHVEAPTAGSIALAAILLKLGGYGFIRFLIPLFREPSVFFSPLVVALALIGVIYGSFAACRQTDIKKIIAYSSIAHMNFVVMGIFSFNINSLYGAVVMMIGHGLTSAALFFLAGVLYDRYHTRSIVYFGGLAQVMPVFSIFLFYFTVANFGFPCSLSFVGELFLFFGVVKEFGLLVSLIVGLSSVFGVYLNMNLFLSICFGSMNNRINNIYQDLSPREFKIMIALTAVSFLTFIFHAKYAVLLSETSSLHFHLYV